MKTKAILCLLIVIVFAGCKNRKVTKLIEHANNEFIVQNYEASISLYDQCLELNPNHTVALMNKALANIKLNDFENALLNLDFILQINPKHDKATYQKAMCLYQLGSYTESNILFSSLLNYKDYDSNELNFYMGLCQYALGNNIQALQNFSQITPKSIYKTNSNLWSGLIYESMKDWESATNLYKENIEKGHLNAEIYYRLGNCHAKTNNNFYAKYYYNSAIQDSPHYTNAYLQRGLIHFQLKDFNAAISDYNNVIEQDSSYLVPALKGRIASLIMTKQVQKAYNDVNILNELVPDDPYAVSLMSAFTILQNDTSKVNSLYLPFETELSEPFNEF